MTPSLRRLSLALSLAVLSLPARAFPASAQQQDSSFAAVQDTLTNPIRLGCGEHVDPVGYVLFLRERLDLTPDQVQRLQAVDEATRKRNGPLAAAWREDHAKLSELRASYRTAVARIEEILTPEQLAEAMRPPRESPGGGTVRCLLRSHLAIVR